MGFNTISSKTWGKSIDYGIFFMRVSRLSLNRTNGKDSCVRLRTNFLSITCLARLVGLSHVELLVLEFWSSEDFLFFFFLFLSFFP